MALFPWKTGKRETEFNNGQIRLGYRWWLWSLPLLTLLTVPIVAIFLRTSPSQLWLNLGRVEVYQATLLSLRTTLVATLIIVTMGTPIAYLMGRSTFRFKRVLDTLIDLPTVLPPAVAGIALLITFGRRGVLGPVLEAGGMTIAFTATAVVLVQVFIAAPFYLKSAALGFAAVDSEMEQAAAMDGATDWQVLRYITLPLAYPALLSGAVLAWARALGEFGATLIFAGNFPGRTQTMPLAIYIGFETDLTIALTLSVILIVVSFFSLMVVKFVLQG